ncbi:MAG: TIGR03088 family PEP-CTERM/XrtA system glycosyltransferase [Thauera propionica]|jgi:sugar transferase (PEP-CTERM/EpsH1 system associated)|uniref:TIGR03088 family PEP-CTERM/XrtA system glycosyltransferase n=1 Tax=Thauera sp. TaxID=1905334 RepID=UPI0025800875|nr:TIGR03088 family PEP-CTERM/XrtA system glycosyltransferase [Thauera sp.]MDY0045850.1 TIGR03088 family PEP-CTERM/XrtA system glycosyltransferase [Thauera propionica]
MTVFAPRSVDSQPLVMHVVYSFDVGGLENGVVNLINRMPADRFRHAVVALTACADDFCKRVQRDDVQFLSLHKPPGHGIKLYPRLYRLFRTHRPAVVHTRNLAALEAIVPAWAAGVPVRVHGEHGWDVSDPHGTRRKFQVLRRAYSPFVQRYVALSGQIERYLVDRVGIPAQRVERICNGVDTERFQPGAAAGRAPLAGSPFNDTDAIVVGTVGRLQAVKDQLNLVRALAVARERGGATGEKLRLAIAGDGPLRPAVEEEIRRHRLSDAVWLAGERRDVPEVMRGFDVFALPSKAEGISNTILEAMSSGLPVVATAVGGNAELVSESKTGALVPAEDPAAMADALLCYASDAALRHRHGQAGRLKVEQSFSLAGMVARYTDLYERLLRQRAN